MLVFKPIYIDIPVDRLLAALCENSEHDTCEATDGLGAEETVLHPGQLGEVDAIGGRHHVVEVLVGRDAQISIVADKLDFLFIMAGLT